MARSASGVASLSQPHVGGGATGVVVGLRGDARPGVGLGHPALVDEAPHPHVLGRPDDHDEVVVGAHPLLDEQRHVVHDDRVRAGVVDDLRGAVPDRRVGQGLEVAQGRRVTEDDPAEGRPVEPAVAVDDVRAEPVDDGGQRRGAGLDDLARHGIGVDDHRPERRELGRHGRLAGADPPVRPTRSMSATLARRPRRSGVRVGEPGREAAGARPAPSGWA